MQNENQSKQPSASQERHSYMKQRSVFQGRHSHNMFQTEKSNMSLALPLLHIINANFIAHTIDNI